MRRLRGAHRYKISGTAIIWGTSDGDAIIWGTSDGDAIIWGTAIITSPDPR
jgi:hypothetical protein